MIYGSALGTAGAAAAVTALVLAVAVIVPALTMRHGGAAATEPGVGIPEFTLADDGGDLRVIQTVTGRVVGTVSAPAGLTFTGVVSGEVTGGTGKSKGATRTVTATATSQTELAVTVDYS